MPQQQIFTSAANSPLFSSGGSTAPSGGGVNSSLKTRMLQEARRERQRVLDCAAGAAAAPWAAATTAEQAAQTDLVTILAPGAPVSAGPVLMPPIHEDGCGAFLSSSPQCSRPGSPTRRDQQDRKDEEAQAEALQTLRSLAVSPPKAGKTNSPSPFCFAGSKAADAELQKARVVTKELEHRLATEKKKTKATQGQVYCLEQELDGKEEALQCKEMALEAQSADLKQAQGALAQLRAELLATQQILLKTTADHDRQLSHQHQYVQSFFEITKQRQGSILEGDLSTAASSDRGSYTDRGSDRGTQSLDFTLCSKRGSGGSSQFPFLYPSRSFAV